VGVGVLRCRVFGFMDSVDRWEEVFSWVECKTNESVERKERSKKVLCAKSSGGLLQK